MSKTSWLGTCSEEEHVLWDERAAIMHFSGKVPKEKADRLAAAVIERERKRRRSSTRTSETNTGSNT